MRFSDAKSSELPTKIQDQFLSHATSFASVVVNALCIGLIKLSLPARTRLLFRNDRPVVNAL